MTVRLAAVEDVLGSPVDQLTAADLRRAVDDHVSELPDLDFKMTLYKDVEELAKDVAAMANATGGLLVLGIRDENGKAQELTPVALSDGEERRMHQSLRARTVPFIPDVEIRSVIVESTDAGEQRGCYLIAVGRSLLAPHGVMAQGDEKKKTYWPVRNGTSTRYLSEPELADFYRRRFRGEEARDKELDRVWREGMARLISKPMWVYSSEVPVWLAVACVPTLPGQLPAGSALLRHAQDVVWNWADQSWPVSYLGQPLTASPRLGRFVSGVRRAIWDSDGFEGDDPQSAFIELHRSGAAFAAVGVSEPRQRVAVLHQQWIEAELLGLLHLFGRHARQARATGEMTLLAGLYTKETRRMTLGRSQAAMNTKTVEIPGAMYASGEFTSEPFSVGLDELLSHEGAARVTFQFATDFAGLFGIPDAGLVTERGTLRADSLPGFSLWAESVGLTRED